MGIGNNTPKSLSILVSGLVILSIGHDGAHAQNRGLQADDTDEQQLFASPKSVRNTQPVDGEEVTVLRSFKIKKGSYPEFYRQSVTGIWPYFEKIGARIVGMWQVDHDALDFRQSKDYDEAILLTRYASLDHWRASRAPLDLGGNGPDAEALMKAHRYRQSVTIKTSFKILIGKPADNGPYHMPAMKD